MSIGVVYTAHTQIFFGFLQQFKENDYKEYLSLALAQRVPIIAHRDHFNLIGFIQGKIPKSYQMKSRGKLADMDLDERDENDVKNDEVKLLDVDILQKYKKMGCPVDELIVSFSVIFNNDFIQNFKCGLFFVQVGHQGSIQQGKWWGRTKADNVVHAPGGHEVRRPSTVSF